MYVFINLMDQNEKKLKTLCSKIKPLKILMKTLQNWIVRILTFLLKGNKMKL